LYSAGVAADSLRTMRYLVCHPGDAGAKEEQDPAARVAVSRVRFGSATR
jgi:hypothetical protein